MLTHKQGETKVNKLVRASVNTVLNVAEDWRNTGYSSLEKYINSKTKFGIEIECFTKFGRGYRNALDRYRDSTLFRDNITQLWADLKREDLPLLNDLLPETSRNILLEYLKKSLTRNEPPSFFYSIFEDRGAISWLNQRYNSENSNLNISFSREIGTHIIEDKFPLWNRKGDGTVSYTADEFVSPILVGQGGLKEVYDFLEILKASCFEVDGTCGAHTSLTYSGGTGTLIKRLALLVLWGSAEKDLCDLLPNMRGDVRYTAFVSKQHNIGSIINDIPRKPASKIINSLGNDPHTKYLALSIKKSQKDRVEFRAWEGTLNYETWVGQIGFGALVLGEAAKLSTKLAQVRKDIRQTSQPKVTTKKHLISKEEIKEFGYSPSCQCDPCVLLRTDFPEETVAYDIHYAATTRPSGTNGVWVNEVSEEVDLEEI